MRTARAAFGVVLGLLATGCARDAPSRPTVLVDGSPALPPPVTLEGVEHAATTRVRVLPADEMPPGSSAKRCLGARSGRVIERVGVDGISITTIGAEGREVNGCDAVGRRPDGGWNWCGRAFARLHAGRLRDPRLSLTCRGADGERVGFAWVHPVATAAYVVVARDGYGEAYPVAAGMPVRVSTDEIDGRTASAAFSASEHTKGGRLLRTYVVEARVSG